jgi:hypothetical protein
MDLRGGLDAVAGLFLEASVDDTTYALRKVNAPFRNGPGVILQDG